MDQSDIVKRTLSLIECSVCWVTCLPPIRQCMGGGHLTCNACLARLEPPALCPVCKDSRGTVRCLVADRIVGDDVLGLLEIECPYGCARRMPLRQAATHRCPCRPFVCPGETCSVTASRSVDIARHFDSTHSFVVSDIIGHRMGGSFSLGKSGEQRMIHIRCSVLFVVFKIVKDVGILHWAWHCSGRDEEVAFPYTLILIHRGLRVVHSLETLSLRYSAEDIEESSPSMYFRVNADQLNEEMKVFYTIDLRSRT